MTTQAETSTARGLDVVKWVLAVALLVAATLGNEYLVSVAPAWRMVGVVVLAVLALVVVLTTVKGAAFIQLLKDARVEARKIVWPTKQETWQTTLIVALVVIVTSLMLWGIDTLFGWIIKAVIG